MKRYKEKLLSILTRELFSEGIAKKFSKLDRKPTYEEYKTAFETALREMQGMKNTAKEGLGESDWFRLHHPHSYRQGKGDAFRQMLRFIENKV